jgi:pyruvate kinase
MFEHGGVDVPLVAKLERPQALEHLDEIMASCQAVMVARGDLGLEMPLEHVPRAQRDIILNARRRGIPVILATQVLESMTHEARPRARVSDAAQCGVWRRRHLALRGDNRRVSARTAQNLDATSRVADR